MTSLQVATNAIQKIATLTDCCHFVLKKHGSYTQDGPNGHTGVLFGSCAISTDRFRLRRRMVCPTCLSINGVSTCCWELHDYDVCHEHGCYLVGCCSGCDRPLSWSSTSWDICSCGVRYADIQTEMAPINRILICELMGDAMSETIARSNQDEVAFGALTPLYWFFAISNFLRAVLIPKFFQEQLGINRPTCNQICEKLLLVLLKDGEYYSHLRQVILLRAVGKPMTMAQTLRSGIFEKEIRACFRPCLEIVTLHSHLFKLKADVIKKRELDFRAAPEFIKWSQKAAAGIT